ncbi:MAG: hypothetical protein OXU20_42880 [Myxococcales bacterium]|nr:hypothetical protein [Myxococcales bacterium]
MNLFNSTMHAATTRGLSRALPSRMFHQGASWGVRHPSAPKSRIAKPELCVSRPGRLGSWLGVLALVLCGPACVLDLEPDVGDVRAGLCRPEDSDPDADVSFSEDILPLFERMGGPGCGCHLQSARRPIGIQFSGLDLTDYSTMLQGGDQSRGDLVVPGDPCASVLVQKISSAPPFGARMPSSGPPYLSPEERTMIGDWIAEGAHDN